MYPIINISPALSVYEEPAEHEEGSDDSTSPNDSNNSSSSGDSGLSDNDPTLWVDSASTMLLSPSLQPHITSSPSFVVPIFTGYYSISSIPQINSGSMPTINPLFSIQSTPYSIQKHDDFRFEAARLSSFRNWFVSYVNPKSLAAAGFYYTGKMDRAKCFVCEVVVSHWPKYRTPMQVHEIWSPKCRFVRNEHCVNVPIGTDPDEFLRAERRNNNIRCPYGLEYLQSFDFNSHKFLTQTEKPTAYELSRLGLIPAQEPKYSNYVTYESRLQSFVTWPNIYRKSEELAEAGFLYTGTNCIVICYHCGVKVQHWRINEDAWEHHAHLSHNCCYLLTVRGSEYVNNVTGLKLYATFTKTSIPTIVSSPVKSTSENETIEMTLVQKIAALEEKNKKLKDARLCKVCKKQEATIVFLPCRHLETCQSCSYAFEQCINCRINIKAVTRIYFS